MYREIKEDELRVDYTNKGYVYFNDSKHPLNSGGKVYYHRHLASIKEGRWLTSEEHVHHKDEDKQNNLPDNLLVLSREEHGRLHAVLRGEFAEEAIKKCCVVCGNLYQLKTPTQTTCSDSCRSISNWKVYITAEELEVLIWNFPYTSVGKYIGLSDTGVKKKARALGCELPPPRFHTRNKEFQDKVRKEYNKATLSSIYEARSVNG